LKEIESIFKISNPEEELKGEFADLKVSPKTSKKASEEDFECFDHNYFVHEFRALFKQIKDTEFSLKSQLGMKRKASKTESNYQLSLHMKQEVEMKLNFLARVTKINPRELLEDIQHNLDLLRKINHSGEAPQYEQFTYIEDVYYEDEYCEENDSNVFSVYTVAQKGPKGSKKKNKNKTKGKKEGSDIDKAPKFMYT